MLPLRTLLLRSLPRSTLWIHKLPLSKEAPVALRSKKAKSRRADTVKQFIDLRQVRTIGGKGGDGDISFLQLWSNAEAGPDGGDGGSGGHVVFQASSNVNNLSHLTAVLQGDAGERGFNKDCHGKNAQHTVAKVPIGTIVKNQDGCVVGDLKEEGTMFLAARGGAGGHGNHFFVSDTEQAPEIAELGADGEDLQYTLEICSIAHIGLIGYPNAGKSTLLQAISRARPKVAPHPFTTLRPHLGIVQYSDHEQVAVADLPGLIPDSHKNRGLGIEFLKHAERCMGLLYILDASCDEPWLHLNVLRNELHQFSSELGQRPEIVVANKMDLPEAQENFTLLQEHIGLPVIPISAKMGTNLSHLLQVIRKVYDENMTDCNEQEEEHL